MNQAAGSVAILHSFGDVGGGETLLCKSYFNGLYTLLAFRYFLSNSLSI